MSPLEQIRRVFIPTLPRKLQNINELRFVSEPLSTRIDSEVKRLIPHTADQPLLSLIQCESLPPQSLQVGVVLSGGQAAGGHNVITGLYDALKQFSPNSRLFGFLNGPSGIVECSYIELSSEMINRYRNLGGFDMIGSGRTKIETKEQFEAARKTAELLKLDGIVIVGGDDSNTNAALLAEYFSDAKVNTSVVGVPKTIDGDLKNEYIETSFGFDTATKTYSEIIGNLEKDALSAGKYYFFVKIMGRTASHIALECALRTHPNYTIISEEVAEKKLTLNSLTKELCDMICQRAEKGKNHGVILIPEGVIEFIPEFKQLIVELNDLLSKGKEGAIAEQLGEESRKCYQTLPSDIQLQLILDRDPHGNVQVSKIETERLFIELVREELKRRKKQGVYPGKFNPQPFFCGYEGRSCLPSNFDAHYCYALGHAAALLVRSGATGYMSCVQGLTGPVEEWKIAGIPISALLVMEKRKGKLTPVIRKALVELSGRPFLSFACKREEWKVVDDYVYPGPIQFFGPEEIKDSVTITLLEEQSREGGG